MKLLPHCGTRLELTPQMLNSTSWQPDPSGLLGSCRTKLKSDASSMLHSAWHELGVGHNETTRTAGILVLGSIYQGFMLGTYFRPTASSQ